MKKLPKSIYLFYFMYFILEKRLLRGNRARVNKKTYSFTNNLRFITE
jgi:hypothetical protein